MNASSLYTQDREEIPLFSKDYSYFLNKSVILYGSSGSGKSTIIRDILFILKDHIPNVNVICPTNTLNKSYDDIIPQQLIHPDITEDLIKMIFFRQKIAVKIYNLANDIQKLQILYAKMPNKDNNKLKILLQSFNEIKNKLETNDKLNVSDRNVQLQKLNEEHDKNLIAFYKKIILQNKPFIDNTKFTDIEIKIINYININPNMLLILDDVAVNANVWCKYAEIRDLFFNSRHMKISFIIALQDDKCLESGLRKNAFINIFTTEVVCNAFFERAANSFTKKDKTKMSKLANRVFNTDNSKEKNYRKFVYIKDAIPNVYYIIASYRDNFKFGSLHLHNFCNKIKKNNNTENDWDSYKAFF